MARPEVLAVMMTAAIAACGKGTVRLEVEPDSPAVKGGRLVPGIRLPVKRREARGLMWTKCQGHTRKSARELRFGPLMAHRQRFSRFECQRFLKAGIGTEEIFRIHKNGQGFASRKSKNGEVLKRIPDRRPDH